MDCLRKASIGISPGLGCLEFCLLFPMARPGRSQEYLQANADGRVAVDHHRSEERCEPLYLADGQI